MKYLSLILIVFSFACTTNTSETDSDNQNVEETVVEEVEQPVLGVFFKNLSDGDVVTSPVIIEMGVDGMEVEPKGEAREGYGHHHLFIDDIYKDAGIFIPADETHIHYGGGQVTDTVDLAPGKHFLTLQFADGMHMLYGFDWSTGVTIVVE